MKKIILVLGFIIMLGGAIVVLGNDGGNYFTYDNLQVTVVREGELGAFDTTIYSNIVSKTIQGSTTTFRFAGKSKESVTITEPKERIIKEEEK